MLKSCASIGCTKRQVSRVSIHIFPVGKVRQKQWLASLKLWLASLKLVNPPVLKHSVLCSDHKNNSSMCIQIFSMWFYLKLAIL